MLKEIKSEEEFDEATLNGLVLIDFWAPWCGPCKQLSPVIKEIAEENSKLSVIMVNAESLPSIAMGCGVRSLPSIVLYENKRVIDGLVGLTDKKSIQKMINSHNF